jgi:hypothetical protein
MLSLPTQGKWIYFLDLVQPKDFVTFDVVQTKEKSYCDWHPIDQFFPLASEVFGCLHKEIDVVLHDCANVIWSLKMLEGLHLFVLVTFFRQDI